MKKILSLAQNINIKMENDIKEIMNPSKVFLPIDETATLKIKSKTVLKGELLYTYLQKDFYSPVSGYIKNIVKRKDYSLKEVSFMQIQNDYQELSNYKGVDGTTTIISPNLKGQILNYKEYDFRKLQNKKMLYVNGLEDEPLIFNKQKLHENYANEILLMIDLLCDALNIESSCLLLKETDYKSILSFEKNISTYPNVSLFYVKDEYPIEDEKNVKKYLNWTDNCVMLSTDKIYDVYYEIVKGRQKDFTFVTILGDAIPKSFVCRAKVGTYLKEIIDNTKILQDKDCDILVNGLMKGTEAKLENIYLTLDVKAVFFMKKKKEKMRECINCGKCNEVCPLKCRVYECVKTKGRIKPLNCDNCGLCTFICPSHIDISKYLSKEEQA